MHNMKGTHAQIRLMLMILASLLCNTITQAGSIKKCCSMCYMFIFPNWMGYTQLFSCAIMQSILLETIH